VIDRKSLREFIDDLEYPLTFLDFETVNTAVSGSTRVVASPATVTFVVRGAFFAQPAPLIKTKPALMSSTNVPEILIILILLY